ncbi:MAG: hypothetical protein QOG53_3176 [Frankiales bacterium]|jgi:hypothetical protein|nr:hypothetical protein [Frankiales bacterium]
MVAAAMAPITLLGGCSCSGNAHARASPTPTPAPSPTAPAFPKTSDGAAQFARLYYAKYSQALHTGVTTEIRAMSDPVCATCNARAAAIDRRTGTGAKFSGGTISVVYAAAPGFTGSQVTVTVIINQAKGTVVQSGRVIERIKPAVRRDDEVEVSWRSSGWIITAINTFSM